MLLDHEQGLAFANEIPDTLDEELVHPAVRRRRDPEQTTFVRDDPGRGADVVCEVVSRHFSRGHPSIWRLAAGTVTGCQAGRRTALARASCVLARTSSIPHFGHVSGSFDVTSDP